MNRLIDLSLLIWNESSKEFSEESFKNFPEKFLREIWHLFENSSLNWLRNFFGINSINFLGSYFKNFFSNSRKPLCNTFGIAFFNFWKKNYQSFVQNLSCNLFKIFLEIPQAIAEFSVTFEMVKKFPRQFLKFLRK